MALPVRLLFSVPRSGSTLFMSVMANLDEVAVTSRTILMGHYYKTALDHNGEWDSQKAIFKPDHAIYNGLHFGEDAPRHAAVNMAIERKAKCLISKEEVGNNRLNRTAVAENECNFQLYPNLDALCAVRPVFVFRHPLPCFASWYKLGWHDVESFIQAYKNVYETAQLAMTLRPETVIYKLEDVSKSHEVAANVFAAICDDWDLAFTPSMLSLEREFAERFLFWHPREEKIYREENPKGIFSTLMGAKSITAQPSRKDILPADIVSRLEKEVVELYENLDTRRFLAQRPGSMGHSPSPRSLALK